MPRSSTLAFTLLALLAPRPAVACTCRATPAPPEALARASAVFVGRVLSVSALHAVGAGIMAPGGGIARTLAPERQADTARGRAHLRVMFVVSRAWKGVAQDTISVVTGSGGGDCGYRFYVDGIYLVYAFRLPQSSGLYVGVCSRTSAPAEAGRDLAALGAPGYTHGGHAKGP